MFGFFFALGVWLFVLLFKSLRPMVLAGREQWRWEKERERLNRPLPATGALKRSLTRKLLISYAGVAVAVVIAFLLVTRL